MLLGMLAFVATPQAYATAELQLTSGATNVIVSDNGSGDLDPTVGQIIFSGAVGDWNINLTTGLSHGPGLAAMDLGSTDATSTGPSTLIIEFSDTGFTVGAPGFEVRATGHITNSGSGTATIDSWFDNSNVLFGQGGSIATLGPFSPSYDATGSSAGPGVPLYSLTEQITLTSGTGGVEWSTDTTLSAVPEPASVALLGGVLLFTVSAIRRKARRAS